jgi:hypothetical protein
MNETEFTAKKIREVLSSRRIDFHRDTKFTVEHAIMDAMDDAKRAWVELTKESGALGELVDRHS